MRRAAGWVGGTVGCVLLAGAAAAQPPGQDAVVRAPTAEVRGGRSEIFPVTGVLRQGQPVHVVREEDGYLAITPPPGSSSWVSDRAIKFGGEMPRPGRSVNAVVTTEEAVIRLGNDRAKGPLQIETLRAPKGTILRILGDKAFAENTEWWRIQPPPNEVRYVAKGAVNVPSTMVVTASPNTAAPAGLPAGQPTNPLWDQAERAAAAGDRARAELLYRQLAGEMAQPGGDHDLAIRCYNRIEQLGRAQPLTWPARQQAPGMLVSSARPPVSAAPPAVAPAPPPPTQAGAVASGPGWLRRTSVLIDGKQAYVLEDNRGQPRYYLLAQPGLNLETFVNRPVEVFGPLVQRSDVVGGGYLSVGKLHLLR